MENKKKTTPPYVNACPLRLHRLPQNLLITTPHNSPWYDLQTTHQAQRSTNLQITPFSPTLGAHPASRPPYHPRHHHLLLRPHTHEPSQTRKTRPLAPPLSPRRTQRRRQSKGHPQARRPHPQARLRRRRRLAHRRPVQPRARAARGGGGGRAERASR